MPEGALSNGGLSGLFTDFGEHSAAQAASTTTLASAMLFGTIAFASVSLAARTYLTGDTRALREAHSKRSKPLDLTSFSSVYSLLHHLTVFGLILFYAYICEYHPPYPHSIKTYDRDEFIFLCTLLIVASVYTWKRNDPNAPPLKRTRQVAPSNKNVEILNRNQTEEWKGWMQFVFLLYHYYHAEEAYNLVRILITCYVWMTGFGNFSFFYLKGDYGLVRILQMMWRLNFLVIFLCLTQGTTYILYYICLLHTYYFLMVYATMRIFKRMNYSKWGIRMKLAAVALLILLVWDFDTGLFRLVHIPFLGEKPVLGAVSGSMWEWYYRSSLDHWSTFLGMMFALNFPITSLFFRKLEAQPPIWEFMAKGAVGLALFMAFLVWFKVPFQHGKVEYNQTNAYFGFIPLMTYIYFRNLTPWLRSHSMELMHEIGKTTLETYLMQHHIWLTSNAKSLLTLVPGWPKVNMLVVSIVYFLVARKLHHLTLYLRGIVLPDDKKECLKNLAIMFSALLAYFALACSLKSLGVLNLTTIGIVSVGMGSLLYKLCMDLTWRGFKESAMATHTLSVEETVLEKMVGNGAGRPNYDNLLNVISAPLVGALVVIIVGITWHGMAQVGGTAIGLLPQGCEAFVNQGTWIPVDPCNEESRGIGYRNHGISTYATCASQPGAYVWGWKHVHPSSHCRFTHRDAKSLRKALSHRTITFVGDSITRHVYHAILRQMGLTGAGAYNTRVAKQSDFTNNIGDTTLEFEWAALATDQVLKLRDIIARPEETTNQKNGVRPDVVVMGGGAWDRLHVFATDEDRESHRATVKELVQEIRSARSSQIPVVWIVPTTINTNALLTEEKQLNIKEEEMAAMRALYDSLGVTDAASFVLDGPSFTQARVEESYDGVHYPLSVYDAGAQILANSLDWLLQQRDPDPFQAPMPGSMAKPVLGIMMLCFVFIGLFCFDGLLGFSYLAVFFVSDVMPSELYDQAFDELHERTELAGREDDDSFNVSIGLTSVSDNFTSSKARIARSKASERSYASGKSGISSSGISSASGRSSKSSGKGSESSAGSIDDEIAALLGTTSRRLDLNKLEGET